MRRTGVVVQGTRRVMLLIASVAIVAGCSGDPAISPQPTGAAEMTFHDYVVEARAQAESGGADDAQLAILDEALTSNEISFEAAQQALNAYGDCLEGAGLELVGLQVIDDGGFKRFEYGVSLGTDDATSVVADACYTKTFSWVDTLYQTQPAAIEASDARFDEVLPQLIDCLQAGGVPVDDDSPVDEVKQVMMAFMLEHTPQPGDPGVTENDDGSVTWDVDPPEMLIVPECLVGVGIDGF